jgi:uncharacterized small protein (DUF1192 family)
MFDEEAPEAAAGYRLGENLEAWSVDDLNELFGNLQIEIARVEGEIDRKRGRISSAESLFKL